CSVDQCIYGHLTLRDLAVLAEERAIRVRPDGSGGWFSTSIQATPRPNREEKHRGEPRSFPPTADNPITSASVRSISKDSASPAPKMKRPWALLPRPPCLDEPARNGQCVPRLSPDLRGTARNSGPASRKRTLLLLKCFSSPLSRPF